MAHFLLSIISAMSLLPSTPCDCNQIYKQ